MTKKILKQFASIVGARKFPVYVSPRFKLEKGDEPHLRDLVRELRDLNKHYDGPGNVSVCFKEGTGSWFVVPAFTEPGSLGNEEIPGDDKKFDATRVARRLICAVRDWHERRASKRSSAPRS